MILNGLECAYLAGYRDGLRKGAEIEASRHVAMDELERIEARQAGQRFIRDLITRTLDGLTP